MDTSGFNSMFSVRPVRTSCPLLTPQNGRPARISFLDAKDAGVLNRTANPPGCTRNPGPTFVFLVVLAALLFGALPAGGQDLSPDTDELLANDPKVPWQIAADEISYDDRAQRYVAEGNVRITKGDRRLTADYVRFDHRTMEAEARGHVVLVAGGDMLFGDRVEIDLENQIGTITQGTIFLHENHFYIRGEKIEKLGPQEYAVERASLSSCDGERPSWKITGRKLKVEIEGEGVIKHAALWAKDVPVLYTPYFSFPATTKRKSGFLMPEFGSSDRQGDRLLVPFYWAINEQADLTLYNDFMTSRGNKVGGEFRYIVDPATKGAIMFDYLSDRKTDNGRGDDHSDYGYPDDNFLRPNESRYWLRMKHDQGLPFAFRGRLDLDLVSDQDYLTEFRRGLTGFEMARDYFRNEFGRDIDDFNDPVRTNQAVMTKNWNHSALTGGIIWLDDSTKRRADELPSVDTTLQRLPFAVWDASKQQIGSTPFQISADTEWQNFYSDDNTKGLRFDVLPRLYLPFSLGDYLYVEPSAGVRQTAWFIDRFQDITPEQQAAIEARAGRNLPREKDKDKDEFRTLYDFRVDVSTEVSGIYNFGGEKLDAVRHTIRPRVVYEYTPKDDQDEFPAFFSQAEDGEPVGLNDGVNRVNPENLITYSLVNTFTSKYREPAPDDDTAAAGAEAEAPLQYNDFMRLEFRQSYNIRVARSDKSSRPFSPIRAQLELYPRKYLSLKAEAAYDTYEMSFRKRDLRATLTSPRGDELTVDYRYDKRKFDFSGSERLDKNVQSIMAGAKIKLPFNFMVYGSTEYNLQTERRLESIIGLTYDAQCWSLDVNYTDAENNDKAIGFRVTLNGLGGYGLSEGIGSGGN